MSVQRASLRMTRLKRYIRNILMSSGNFQVHSYLPRRLYFHPQSGSQSSPLSNIDRRTIHASPSSLGGPHSPRLFPNSGFELLDPSENIEEETLPTYQTKKYYPARIGEVLNDQYQVLAKLGYGVTSTMWLCRDLSESKYIVLKIYISGVERNHEINIYDRINSTKTNHLGRKFIRKLLTHFSIEGPHGRHTCLVHQPLGLSVDLFLSFLPKQVLTLEDLKPCLRQILGVLDFLHSEAHIIHTDLQLKNLLLPADDPQIFSAVEEAEIEDPSPRKVLDDGQTIYMSRLLLPSNGLPLLSDFGEARFGDEEHNADIMPNVYRAPEVVLKINWDYKVDIWNVAVMAWDMVCSRTLFNGRNHDDIFDDRVHIAEMIALLGPPPVEFRKRTKLCSVFWDDHGTWKDLAPIPDITLERLAADIEGEDKEGFLQFLLRALKWIPEDRPTAKELLFDTWLMKGLDLRSRTQNTE